MRLSLGSGFERDPDTTTVDVVAECKPDVVHDLSEFPWPFDNSTFTSVLARDVLEHLPDTVRTMEEIHRICEPGAVLEITTPHFTSSNSYTDPTHVHHFGFYTFDHFTGDATHNHYTGVRFEYQSRWISFQPADGKNPIEKTIEHAANRWPAFYERRLCWLYPAWFLRIRLRALK